MTSVIVLRSGQTISRRQLERLRMLMDWQIRQERYNPTDITLACLESDAAYIS